MMGLSTRRDSSCWIYGTIPFPPFLLVWRHCSASGGCWCGVTDATRGYGALNIPWENLSSSSGHPSCWGGGRFGFGAEDEGIGRGGVLLLTFTTA